MRNLLCILFFVSTLSATEGMFSIQVLSVKDKNSISETFIRKVKAVSAVYTQKKVKDHYKIFVGEYKTREEALSDLALIQEKVHKDAFVTRMEEELVLEPKQRMQQAMLMAQARTLQKMKKEEVKVKEKELESIEPIKVVELQEKIVIQKKETKTVTAMKEDVKTEKIYCKPSKRALREAEISDALAFYRESSFYMFTN